MGKRFEYLKGGKPLGEEPKWRTSLKKTLGGDFVTRWRGAGP